MRNHTLFCPNCHHAIKVEKGATQAVCSFCGAIVEDIPPEFFDGNYTLEKEGGWSHPDAGYTPPYPSPPSPSQSIYIPHAGLVKRALAWLVDSIIISIFIVAIFLALIGMSFISLKTPYPFPYGLETGLVIISLVTIAINIAYFTFFEAYFYQTPGKMILGIMVVNENLSVVDSSSAFLRNVMRILYTIPFIGILFYIIDAILIAKDEQRIGDKIAKTFVVQKDYLPHLQRR